MGTREFRWTERIPKKVRKLLEPGLLGTTRLDAYLDGWGVVFHGGVNWAEDSATGETIARVAVRAGRRQPGTA
jgi:hypothetical protein